MILFSRVRIFFCTKKDHVTSVLEDKIHVSLRITESKTDLKQYRFFSMRRIPEFREGNLTSPIKRGISGAGIAGLVNGRKRRGEGKRMEGVSRAKGGKMGRVWT